MTAATGEACEQLRGLVVRVTGKPQPQGSKTPMPVRRGGKVVSYNLVEGRRDEAREAFGQWRSEVIRAAREEMGGETWRLSGPVALRVTFTRPRLASHYGTGRNAGVLKASAPVFAYVKPDGGKLQRAVEDALTLAGVWEDDARVAVWLGLKMYADPDRSPFAPVQFRVPAIGLVEADPLPVPGVVIRVAQIGA